MCVSRCGCLGLLCLSPLICLGSVSFLHCKKTRALRSWSAQLGKGQCGAISEARQAVLARAPEDSLAQTLRALRDRGTALGQRNHLGTYLGKQSGQGERWLMGQVDSGLGACIGNRRPDRWGPAGEMKRLSCGAAG